METLERCAVNGTRLGYIWPPGYTVPRWRETENVVGLIPKGDGCQYKAFVIDGFHGYNNNGRMYGDVHVDDIHEDDLDDFFKAWPWDQDTDANHENPPEPKRCPGGFQFGPDKPPGYPDQIPWWFPLIRCFEAGPWLVRPVATDLLKD